MHLHFHYFRFLLYDTQIKIFSIRIIEALLIKFLKLILLLFNK